MTETQRILAETLKENCKPDSASNLTRFPLIKQYCVRSKNTTYENTDEGKNAVLQELYLKLEQANSLPATSNNSGKNLIYFSVFLSDNYVDLVEISLQSILDSTPNINFDILFITDEEYKIKLLQKPILNKFNCYFYTGPTPFSGPRASIRKLFLFDFIDINNYEKILFLDCDTVCIKDINFLFNLEISPENLYTGTTRSITPNALTTPTHGIMYFTERDLEILVQDYQSFKAFNAGQFLMYNTPQMKAHFENLRWFIKNWPGDLFFEQGPMNYYFVINKISKILKTDKGREVFAVTPSAGFNKQIDSVDSARNHIKTTNARIVPIVTGSTITACPKNAEEFIKKYSKKETFDANILNDDTCIIHFAGSPLAGEKKIEKITEYINARKS
jgi:lipopolysaccharide biosynthesis glycosyltransferase